VVQETRCADRENLLKDAVDKVCVPFIFIFSLATNDPIAAPLNVFLCLFFFFLLVPWAMEVDTDWKF